MKTCTDSSSHPHEVDLSGDDSARLRSRGRSRSQAHGDHQIDSFQRPGTLLIDDEPQIGRLVAHALSVAGCSVAIERSGAAGIAAASTGAFMVVLIDIRLPDMSGLDVLRALRRITPHARLIILSGYLSIEVAVEAMKLGACDAVQKPLSGERLREVVRLAMTPPPPSVLDVRPVPAPAGTGSSVSERWAMLALKACRAERDLKTIADWARIGGVSYSSLL